ncbi:NUDIX hydrolase [Microlunatus sp. Gsoil 973]|jgi:8-oxo-dGTP pyrophosphatase MutT (NUDIX family)|uniref:NUDIX hydrolase n=1 Tax=Microlunatus sp. Gsoil 973 TaxID=2672569 RepID=UPI0012B49F36|nr:NUDIX hydrolase [Microlunatus sp. Gsoil 973]QGN34000.1 NUDIX domain-containing protein [Microlunatus sp. Gsoil 973]
MRVSSRDILARLDRAVPASVIDGLQSAGPSGPAPAHTAASVVLLRDHHRRLETYALHRHSRMPFAAGMVVFPGGRLDPLDGVPADDHDPADPALTACAVRETEEETGVRLHPEQLRPWAHWITPAFEPRRYDTFFYLAGLPDGQQAADVSGETSAAEWRSPTELLAAADSGEIAVLPPTRSILIELAGFDSVSAALAAATDRMIETVLPRLVNGPDGWVFDYGPERS